MNDQERQREVKADADADVTTTVTDRLFRLVKYVLLPMVAVLIALTATSVVRSFVVQDSVETVQDSADALGGSTEEARKAAVEARDELRAAIRQGQQSSNSPAVANALAAIARIEAYLCGGPCPTQGEP